MPTKKPRNWGLAVWTVAAIVAGIVIAVAVKNPPPETCDYCWIQTPTGQAAAVYVLFGVWLLGLLLILIVDWLVRSRIAAVRERRELRPFVEAREREPRRF